MSTRNLTPLIMIGLFTTFAFASPTTTLACTCFSVKVSNAQMKKQLVELSESNRNVVLVRTLSVATVQETIEGRGDVAAGERVTQIAKLQVLRVWKGKYSVGDVVTSNSGELCGLSTVIGAEQVLFFGKEPAILAGCPQDEKYRRREVRMLDKLKIKKRSH